MNNAASGKNSMAFRNSIGGFNKDDVNNYILRMNRDFKEKELDYKDELDNLREQLNINDKDTKKQLDEKNEQIAVLESHNTYLESANIALGDAKKENADLSDALSALEEKLAAADKIIVEQRGLIEKQALDLDTLTAAKTSAEKTAEALSEELGQLTDSNESASDEVIEKAHRYDQISRQIGDIVINANKTADEIIERANDRADRVVKSAEDEADSRRKYIADMSEQILAKFSADLRTVSDQCVSELSTTLNDLQYDSAALAADFDKKNRLIAEKIAAYKNSLSDALKAELVSLDSKISK
jgi:hypothetical protein